MFKLLFTWQERIGRGPYWAAIVPLTVIAYTLGFLVPDLPLLGPLLVAYPRICVNAKRLHDLGSSGWWQVAVNIAANLTAGLGNIMSAADPDGLGSLVPYLLSLLIELGFIIWLGSVRGQPTANSFGPSPRRADRVEEVF